MTETADEWSAGDRCRLDRKPATVVAVHGTWAWVVKDSAPDDPETVDLTLLERDT